MCCWCARECLLLRGRNWARDIGHPAVLPQMAQPRCSRHLRRLAACPTTATRLVTSLARPFRPKTPKQRHGSHRRGGATKAYQAGGVYAPRRGLAAVPRAIPDALLFGAARATFFKQSRQRPALARCLCFFPHLLRGFRGASREANKYASQPQTGAASVSVISVKVGEVKTY